jgi:hypothetical protein
MPPIAGDWGQSDGANLGWNARTFGGAAQLAFEALWQIYRAEVHSARRRHRRRDEHQVDLGRGAPASHQSGSSPCSRKYVRAPHWPPLDPQNFHNSVVDRW